MNKDWTGNKQSTMAILGASNYRIGERQAHDYYATDPDAVDKLLAKYQLPEVICEPCCGEGHLSKRLESHGHKVYSSDLIDRGYGEVRDFFSMQSLPEDCHCILTNPPFKYSTQVILHALDLLSEGDICAVFMKTQALEGKNRYREVFSVYPPQFVFQFVGRTICAKNGDFKAMESIGSAVAYSWWIFKKGYEGPTILDWLP